MGRKGNCLNNAVMKSLFELLKSKLLYLQAFRSMEHLNQNIKYLDYCNSRHIKIKLKGLPSTVYRQHALSAALKNICLRNGAHFTFSPPLFVLSAYFSSV